MTPTVYSRKFVESAFLAFDKKLGQVVELAQEVKFDGWFLTTLCE